MEVYCNTSCQTENINSYTSYHTIFRIPHDSSRAIVGQANTLPSPVFICFNPILMTYSTAWETLGTISKNEISLLAFTMFISCKCSNVSLMMTV